jgi:hypothetical protein
MMGQAIVILGIIYHVTSTILAINGVTDWLAGINYHGIFSGPIISALRLIYMRGIFDGFIAGAIIVLIFHKGKK